MISAGALKVNNAKKTRKLRKNPVPKNPENLKNPANLKIPDIPENIENKENELDSDDNDDQVGPVTSTPKPKKPGKISLLDHLRSMIETDQADMTDDVIFEAFDFKETLYQSQGFVQGACPCKLDNNMITHMFVFQLRGTDKTVDLCSRCMEKFSSAGQNEDRKLFLQMVLQVTLNVRALFTLVQKV